MASTNRSILVPAAKPFISTWKTDNLSTGSSNNNQVKLPLMPNGTYLFNVNWGDGSSNTITTWNQAETTHTYSAIGTYTITIRGYINGWSFAAISPATGATGDRLKLLTITQWGCLQFNSIITDSTINSGAFYNCTNLTLLTVSDTPNFKGSTSTFNFLRGCTALTLINNVNKWDVSGITYFRSTFRECTNFNDNIGNWNTAKGTNMGIMFYGSTAATIAGKFNNGGSSSIGNWNTSNVTDMANMFQYQPSFNHNLGAWDMSKVTNMNSMFSGCTVAPFGLFDNGSSDSINNWDTSNVTTMTAVFQYQPSFNRNIVNWNTSNVTSMNGMFNCSTLGPAGIFNKDISNWNTSKVTTMNAMFYYQNLFNQEIGKWNVGNVTDMSFMVGTGAGTGVFTNAGSNSIKNWNTSKVTTMVSMFQLQTEFNQEIGTWDVSKVTTFLSFLYGYNGTVPVGKFNNGGTTSINNWNLSSNLSIDRMFFGQPLFNQPINSWNTTTVTNMGNTFTYCYAFNQPIGNWNVSNVTNFSGNFMNYKTFNDYSTANYDALLIGWASRPVKPNLSINFNTIKRTAASTAARLILTSAPNNWTIVDGGI